MCFLDQSTSADLTEPRLEQLEKLLFSDSKK